VAKKDAYYVLVNDEYRSFTLEALVRFVKSQTSRPFIWSARLSTGLVGLTGCSAGNRGPKKRNEVLLAVGDIGLCTLINLGFITCPVCHPENKEGFWNTVEDTVRRKHGIASLDEFVDKAVLPFDARRVEWEEIVPVLGRWPNRLYVPRGLQEHELAELKLRIEKIRYDFPSVGYYDHEAPERFTQYELH